MRIEKTNHSLFAARVTPELSAQAGGVLLNAAGALGEKGTFGTASPWCDVSGTRFGLREGIAIFESPKNRWYPSKWFTRDYGFFSPTPFNWLDDAGLRLAKGETLDARVHGRRPRRRRGGGGHRGPLREVGRGTRRRSAPK